MSYRRLENVPILSQLKEVQCYGEDNSEGAKSAESPKSKVEGLPAKAWFVAVAAVQGGLLFGYDIGVMSGAIVKLAEDTRGSPDWGLESDSRKELIVSAAIWSAAVGAAVSGPLNNIFGRKIVMLLGAAVMTAASFLMAVANNWWFLAMGRALDGIAIGFVSMTGPCYIAEQMPTSWRGPINVCNQLMITIGILMGCVIAGLFSTTPEGWRWMLGLSCVPSCLMFGLLVLAPESVRWLVFKGRNTEAKDILISLRGADVEEEWEEIHQDYKLTLENKKFGGHGIQHLKNILYCRPVRRALVLGVFLQLFQQLSGINSVIFYSASIVIRAGVSNIEQAIWIAAVVSLVNTLFTLIGLYLIERSGRKPLLLGSLVVMIVGLVILGTAFIIMEPQTVITQGFGADGCGVATNCQQCTDAPGCGVCLSKEVLLCINSTVVGEHCTDSTFSVYCPSDKSWVAILGLVVYIAGFAPGMGPLPWAINSEIFPNWARSTCLSITTMTNWICNSIISQTFLRLANAVTPSGAFFLYGIVALIAIVYFIFFLPETKDLGLESAQHLFDNQLVFVNQKKSPENIINESDNSSFR